MAVSKKNSKTAIMVEDSEMIVGAIRQMSNAYSTHFETNFNVDGSPSDVDLEKIFNAPQENIDSIVGYSKYCYRKYGIIMRVINIIRDFGSSGISLEYPKKDAKIKEIIKNYNERIDVDKLISDIIFELSLTGNVVCYDRDGERVDLYPINLIEALPLVKNNKQLVAYKFPMTTNSSFSDYGKEIDDLVESAYPKEVVEARKKNKTLAILDSENTYFEKINSSQYERYGIPVILPAFEDLAHKSLLKEAEKSTANAIIDKILCIKIGDAENKPTKSLIDQYSELFDGLTGSVRVALPYYVDMKWVEPESDIFGNEKFIQIDTDILNTLGVSLTLIRGEGTGSYSDGLISFTGLTRIIDNIRGQIPKILRGLYQSELARNGFSEKDAPNIRFKEVIIDKESKLNLVKELFQNAGLPYEVLYEEYGYNFDHVKLVREEENNNNIEDVFKLRAQPFQGLQSGNGEGANPKEAGAPTKSTATLDRKSDKNRANNFQPRT